MNPEESELIENFIKNGAEPTNTSNKKLILSGIFYMDEENWTVWIDNEEYSSPGQKSGFSIDAVKENFVIVTFPDGETQELSVSENTSEALPEDCPSEK